MILRGYTSPCQRKFCILYTSMHTLRHILQLAIAASVSAIAVQTAEKQKNMLQPISSVPIKYQATVLIFISTKLNQQLLMSRGFYQDIVKFYNFHPEKCPKGISLALLCLCGDIHPHPGPSNVTMKKIKARKP